jgi:GNAT superfamily N-acetyltransferase
MIQVRNASIDDVEQLAAVYVAAWRGGFSDLFSIATFVDDQFESSRLIEVREIVLDDSVTTTVVELDGRIVGFSGFADDKCLDDLWVHPDAWGRGVGPKLIAQIEDEQRNVGVSRLTAWAPEDSPRARGVLAKMGWRPTGEAQPMVIYPEQPNTLFEYERILV